MTLQVRTYFDLVLEAFIVLIIVHVVSENIQWVCVEEIEERWSGAEISALPDVPRLVGSGHSAGGVIGRTVGPCPDAGLAQVRSQRGADGGAVELAEINTLPDVPH